MLQATINVRKCVIKICPSSKNIVIHSESLLQLIGQQRASLRCALSLQTNLLLSLLLSLHLHQQCVCSQNPGLVWPSDFYGRLYYKHIFSTDSNMQHVGQYISYMTIIYTFWRIVWSSIETVWKMSNKRVKVSHQTHLLQFEFSNGRTD